MNRVASEIWRIRSLRRILKIEVLVLHTECILCRILLCHGIWMVRLIGLEVCKGSWVQNVQSTIHRMSPWILLSALKLSTVWKSVIQVLNNHVMSVCLWNHCAVWFLYWEKKLARWYGVITKSRVLQWRRLVHNCVSLWHHAIFLHWLVHVHRLLNTALSCFVVEGAHCRRVLSLLKLYKWCKQNLLWVLQGHESVLTFSAGEDADVADYQGLTGRSLDELLFTGKFAATAHGRHRSVSGKLTLFRKRVVVVVWAIHTLIRCQRPTVLLRTHANNSQILTIWQFPQSWIRCHWRFVQVQSLRSLRKWLIHRIIQRVVHLSIWLLIVRSLRLHNLQLVLAVRSASHDDLLIRIMSSLTWESGTSRLTARRDGMIAHVVKRVLVWTVGPLV